MVTIFCVYYDRYVTDGTANASASANCKLQKPGGVYVFMFNVKQSLPLPLFHVRMKTIKLRRWPLTSILAVAFETI
jgi:hypothetical protein